jgi:hypothetical protein
MTTSTSIESSITETSFLPTISHTSDLTFDSLKLYIETIASIFIDLKDLSSEIRSNLRFFDEKQVKLQIDEILFSFDTILAKFNKKDEELMNMIDIRIVEIIHDKNADALLESLVRLVRLTNNYIRPDVYNPEPKYGKIVNERYAAITCINQRTKISDVFIPHIRNLVASIIELVVAEQRGIAT